MGKKHKKGKLPKELLGIRIPKELRQAGDRLLAEAQGPAGREMIAAGLTMAAAAATAAVARSRVEREAAPVPPVAPLRPEPPIPPVPPVPSIPPRPGGTSTDPQAFAEVIGRAAETFMTGFFARRP